MMIIMTEDQIEEIASHIEDSGSGKIKAIKAVRRVVKCDLLAAKHLIDEYPCPFKGVDGRGTCERTPEQIAIAKESADRFRNDMKGREFLDYGNMEDSLRNIVDTFGLQKVMKYVVGMMGEAE